MTMSKRPMSSIFVSNIYPLNDDRRLFAFPIRLFENTIHPAPLAGSYQHPLLEILLFADYTVYTYVFFCYAPMIPHVSSKSVVCFHILLGVGHQHPPEKNVPKYILDILEDIYDSLIARDPRLDDENNRSTYIWAILIGVMVLVNKGNHPKMAQHLFISGKLIFVSFPQIYPLFSGA